MKYLVKRGGHTEAYDNRKLYASIYASALSVREPIMSAELIASETVKRVEVWLKTKHEVTSNDIRRVAAEQLKDLNPQVGFQYKHHRIIW